MYHVIKFSDIKNSFGMTARVVKNNPTRIEKFKELGYEIVQIPVMVDNRLRCNQFDSPKIEDLDYLMDIPTKKYKEGQKTKQTINDVLTYKITGDIGKDLQNIISTQNSIYFKKKVYETSLAWFVKTKFLQFIERIKNGF